MTFIRQLKTPVSCHEITAYNMKSVWKQLSPCQSVCHFLGFGEHAYAVIKTSWALAGNYTWIWIMIPRNSCNTTLRS
jgi:hypothetical protein